MFREKSEKALTTAKTVVKVIVCVILVLIVFFSSWYTIKEEEQAVVCTLGQPHAVTEPGLHFKIPFVQTVQKVNTTIQGMPIGYNSENDGDAAMMITGDYNFIHVDFYVEYRISEPVKAVYASEDPVLILNNIAQNCIRTTVGSYTVDSVLTTGKNEIQSNIKEMIMRKLETYDIGIQLVNITIQDAEPPTEEVSSAFKTVETAKQGKETALNNANKYRNEQIPKAKAEADKIVQDAQATKQNRINEATGQVARFNSMYDEYVKYPQITKQRMFYEAMEEILPDMKVIIQGADGTTTTMTEFLPLDGFDSSTGTDSQSSDEKSQETDNTDEEENR